MFTTETSVSLVPYKCFEVPNGKNDKRIYSHFPTKTRHLTLFSLL